MHIIGFSHNYTKLYNQQVGTLLAVRCTDNPDNRPNWTGMHYDTKYVEWKRGILLGDTGRKPYKAINYYPMTPEDCMKPLLQLVFIGNEQIPFTTYREFPQDKPYNAGMHLPYSELIGEKFAFKFKGVPLPDSLQRQVDNSPKPVVKIF